MSSVYNLKNINFMTQEQYDNAVVADDELYAVAAGVVYPGTIIAFAGSTAPNGYLVCDGTEVSRNVYAELFNVIGTKYGTGNNGTTFNLPNFTNTTFWGQTDVTANVLFCIKY